MGPPPPPLGASPCIQYVGLSPVTVPGIQFSGPGSLVVNFQSLGLVPGLMPRARSLDPNP